MLIEHGVVRTNFANNIKKIGKTMKPDSPYSRLIEVREANRKLMVESMSIMPEEVARIVLKAINSNSPDLRHVVGYDALRLLDSKMNMSESEFKGFMMGISSENLKFQNKWNHNLNMDNIVNSQCIQMEHILKLC